MREVVCLTEAGASSGMGHLRRSAVLAQELSARGMSCRFGIDTPDGRAMMDAFPVSDYKAALTNASDILIIDGYHFNNADLSAWKDHFNTVVLVDDLAQKPLPAHIVLNHNIYGADLDYAAYPAQRVLGGPQYALVDPAFPKLRARRKPTASSVLIAFGGGETANHGLRASAELAAICKAPIDIAMGTSKRWITHPNITLHQKADMVALMRGARLYFGALGVSFIEALAAGLPAVGVVTADNQALAAAAAIGAGVPVFTLDELGAAAAKVAELTKFNDRHIPDIIDGRGAARVADEVLAFAS